MRRKVESGTYVKFTEKALDFYKQSAYYNNVIHTETMYETNAESYLFYSLLGRGYSYQAKVESYLSEDNYKIEVRFRCGLVKTTNVPRKWFKL